MFKHKCLTTMIHENKALTQMGAKLYTIQTAESNLWMYLEKSEGRRHLCNDAVETGREKTGQPAV